jgi:hypothetical protein
MPSIGKSWQCPSCNCKFSRRWNMTRHIKLKDGAAARPVKTREVHLDLNNLAIPSIPQTSQFLSPDLSGKAR